MLFIGILGILSFFINVFNLSSLRKVRWILVYSLALSVFCYFSFNFAMNMNYINLQSSILTKGFLKLYCILLIFESVLFLLANYALIFKHFMHEKREKYIEKLTFSPSFNFFLTLFLTQVFLLNQLNGISSSVFQVRFSVFVFLLVALSSVVFRVIRLSWEERAKKRILLYFVQGVFAMFLPQLLDQSDGIESNFSMHFSVYLLSFSLIVLLLGVGFIYEQFLRRKK